MVRPNMYVGIIERNGGVGFNASTSADSTTYHYSLPSNRMELWFLMQSEWLRRPVFREFYKERDVVLEERRRNIDSNPLGKLHETMMATAFSAHPYRTLIGWASDVGNLRASQADRFYKTYYVPSNITVAIAGDFRLAEVRQLAERYFGGLPAGPPPPAPATVEPPQEGERRVTVESHSQPYLLIGYKRPNGRHADDPVFDVLAELLAGGRTGLLYRDLVRDRKISLEADVETAVPGAKYPALFLITSAPALGHSAAENERAILDVIERLRADKPEAAALDRVKRKLRAGLLSQLDSNPGLAAQLAFYHTQYGTWKMLFNGLDAIDKVKAEDVQRVAKQYLTATGRTVAWTVPATQPTPIGRTSR